MLVALLDALGRPTGGHLLIASGLIDGTNAGEGFLYLSVPAAGVYVIRATELIAAAEQLSKKEETT